MAGVPSVLRLKPSRSGREPDVALALLQAGLALPSDWANTGSCFGRVSRMNAGGMCQNAMERWMGGHERRKRMRRYFNLIGCLGGAFLTRTLEFVDVPRREPAAIWLSIYGCQTTWGMDQHGGTFIWPVLHQLSRLREVHPPLAGFVYYGLVDALRTVVNVYDWRDAQREFELQAAAANHASGGHLGEAPSASVPAWLGTRARISVARALEAAGACRDPWARKTVEATANLQAAAARLDRKRIRSYPSSSVRGGPSAIDSATHSYDVPDGQPVLLFTFTPHDGIEGYGREAVRHTAMGSYGEVGHDRGQPVVPTVCITADYATPRTLHRAVDHFGRCCVVVERATYVLDLIRKARPRPRLQVRAA